MIQAEADRCYSHGLFRLPWYVSGVKNGRVNGHASPTIEQLRPGVIRMDGDGGYAPLGHRIGQPPLVACAREQGIAPDFEVTSRDRQTAETTQLEKAREVMESILAERGQ